MAETMAEQENIPAETGFQQQTGFVPPNLSLFPKELPQPKKRLIVCCDGTWQSSAHGHHEIPSNVAKMSRSISNWYVGPEGLACPQIVYYDAGVGTAMGWLDKKWSGGFGEGLDENVCEAYNFLVNNYCQGDEVFFFGFSRGAYTVRAVAGLVSRVGICKPSFMDSFWEMYAVYKSIKPEDSMFEKKWAARGNDDGKKEMFTIKVNKKDKQFEVGSGWGYLNNSIQDVDVKVVGVWDTVGSLGYPDNVYTDVSSLNAPYGFHNTNLHPGIKNAFHALALDEHRKPFSPTLWSLPDDNKVTNLVQCWFPGYHINVGGGSSDGLKDKYKGDLESMANTTFAWMVDRCEPFLKFDWRGLDQIFANYLNSLDKLYKEKPEAYKGWGGWGKGLADDSYSGVENMAAGSETRTPGEYFYNLPEVKDATKTSAAGVTAEDKILTHNKKTTNEYIHPVVWHAKNKAAYNPESLKGFVRVSKGPGKGYVWTKTYTHTESQSLLGRGLSYISGRAVKSDKRVISIDEFIIPEKIPKQFTVWNDAGSDGFRYGTKVVTGIFESNGGLILPQERTLILNVSNRMMDGSNNSHEQQKKQSKALDKAGLEYLEQLDKDCALVHKEAASKVLENVTIAVPSI